jgi:hypothetical protein
MQKALALEFLRHKMKGSKGRNRLNYFSNVHQGQREMLEILATDDFHWEWAMRYYAVG